MPRTTLLSQNNSCSSSSSSSASSLDINNHIMDRKESIQVLTIVSNIDALPFRNCRISQASQILSCASKVHVQPGTLIRIDQSNDLYFILDGSLSNHNDGDDDSGNNDEDQKVCSSSDDETDDNGDINDVIKGGEKSDQDVHLGKRKRSDDDDGGDCDNNQDDDLSETLLKSDDHCQVETHSSSSNKQSNYKKGKNQTSLSFSTTTTTTTIDKTSHQTPLSCLKYSSGDYLTCQHNSNHCFIADTPVELIKFRGVLAIFKDWD
ncbi:hypothetical protein DFA_08285 [Cavenderia fasciculata]|uniref:Uncharacterized protein n=1 Tax=Cavenderia fasciculata TaxID=261658 RepID=F4Q5N3_CACFS|nr:uncharacterized protein DFA_08285 [Cavenderia fasciculata]EGG17292.1 hypothetical protein DFA_08285 [Cavenderia fasciculata]|eukprot:XP_004355776.1 hypothetical protein DFA_08285 [Cavenderia fasciculata]